MRYTNITIYPKGKIEFKTLQSFNKLDAMQKTTVDVNLIFLLVSIVDKPSVREKYSNTTKCHLEKPSLCHAFQNSFRLTLYIIESAVLCNVDNTRA